MRAVIDVETQGLNTQNFILGCIVKQYGKPETFYDKESMWKRIKEIAKSERANNKTLTIYAHNAQYDFYAGINFKEKGWKIYNTEPFITVYENEEGKEEIRMNDSMNLYRMSLKGVGELLDYPKGKINIKLYEDKKQKYSQEEIKEIEKYCIRDCEVVLKGVQKIRDELERQGVRTRRITTIYQVAVNYLIKKLAEKTRPYLFYQTEKKDGSIIQTTTIKTKYNNLVREAIRGGNVSCYKTGIIEGTYSIDFNSSYADAIRKIRMPDLRTERVVYNPLKVYSKRDLLNKIGISKVVITNENDEHRFLQVRTGKTGNYHPGINKTIIGTYTNEELKYAEKIGWKIKHIELSVLYDEAIENPFTEIYNEMYSRRKISKWHKYFWKAIIVGSIGKLAQHRTGQQIIIDNVEEAEKYLEKNKKTIMEGFDDENYLYTVPPTEQEKKKKKKYYTPIITALVYGLARVNLMKEMKKIPAKDLVYTDTDNIVFINGNHLKKFKLGDQLGDFKIELDYDFSEQLNKTAIIWGRKTILIGKKAKASGITKGYINPNDFENGYIESKKMVTIKTAEDPSLIGTFEKTKHNLKEQLENYTLTQEKLDEAKVYIDDKTNKLKEETIKIATKLY